MLTYLSSDTLAEQGANGQTSTFYRAQVRLDAERAKTHPNPKLANVALKPGMTATVTEVVQYGPNVRALAVHLTHGQLLPLARSAQLLSQLFALNVSQASVLAWIDEASQRLRPAVEHIAQGLVWAPCRWRMPTNPVYGWPPVCIGCIRWPAKRSLGMGCMPSVACLPSKRTASCVAASRSWCMTAGSRIGIWIACTPCATRICCAN